MDCFYAFPNNFPQRVQDLSCCLKLPFLNGFIKEFYPHTLDTSEHIFAIFLPVFIVPFIDFFPIIPGSFFAYSFFNRVIQHKLSNSETFQLAFVESLTSVLYYSGVASATDTLYFIFWEVFKSFNDCFSHGQEQGGQHLNDNALSYV